MTDDIWRNDDAGDPSAGGRRPGRFEASMDEFDDEEFGGPLFGDDSGGASRAPAARRNGESAGLSFGDDATGPLPHWTEPPTGEMPKIEAAPAAAGESDDLDVWSTFTSESPVWKEGDSVDEPSGTLTGAAASPPPPSASRPVGSDRRTELGKRPDRGGRARGCRSRRLDVDAWPRDHHRHRHGHRRRPAPRAAAHHDRHRSVGHASPA